MFGGTNAGRRQCHDFAQEFASLKRIFDHLFGIDANEGVNDKVHDGTFDVRDVKVQGEGAQGKNTVMRLCQSKMAEPPLR